MKYYPQCTVHEHCACEHLDIMDSTALVTQRRFFINFEFVSLLLSINLEANYQ